MMVQAYEGIEGGAQFGPTHWSMVMLSAQSAAPGAQTALAELCRVYWYPLYAYARRQGHSAPDAQDSTQSFLAALIANKLLARVDPLKGKFRSFLLASFRNFLSDASDRKFALKRGGDIQFVSLDAMTESRYGNDSAFAMTSAEIFEVIWARTLVERSLARVRETYALREKAEVFDALKIFLSDDNDLASYASIAGKLGLGEAALKSAIHRLRRDYRAILREEVARTVSNPGEIDDEIRHLCAALAHAGTA